MGADPTMAANSADGVLVLCPLDVVCFDAGVVGVETGAGIVVGSGVTGELDVGAMVFLVMVDLLYEFWLTGMILVDS